MPTLSNVSSTPSTPTSGPILFSLPSPTPYNDGSQQLDKNLGPYAPGEDLATNVMDIDGSEYSGRPTSTSTSRDRHRRETSPAHARMGSHLHSLFQQMSQEEKMAFLNGMTETDKASIVIPKSKGYSNRENFKVPKFVGTKHKFSPGVKRDFAEHMVQVNLQLSGTGLSEANEVKFIADSLEPATWQLVYRSAALLGTDQNGNPTKQSVLEVCLAKFSDPVPTFQRSAFNEAMNKLSLVQASGVSLHEFSARVSSALAMLLQEDATALEKFSPTEWEFLYGQAIWQLSTASAAKWKSQFVDLGMALQAGDKKVLHYSEVSHPGILPARRYFLNMLHTLEKWDGVNDKDEKRAAPDADGPGKPPKKSKDLCRDFQTVAGCTRDKCRFRHEKKKSQEVEPKKQKGMCHQWEKDKTCKFGDKCKFTHTA